MQSQQQLIHVWLNQELNELFYDTSSKRELLKRIVLCEETANKAYQLEELIRLIELSSSTGRLKHARNLIVIYKKIKEQLTY